MCCALWPLPHSVRGGYKQPPATEAGNGNKHPQANKDHNPSAVVGKPVKTLEAFFSEVRANNTTQKLRIP